MRSAMYRYCTGRAYDPLRGSRMPSLVEDNLASFYDRTTYTFRTLGCTSYVVTGKNIHPWTFSTVGPLLEVEQKTADLQT